ncbi:hypothetical protein GBAR_LOCUS25133 [Geodia barretti]|uniref:Fibronectin type-III domain-containing protein n=1 Tax=Geodia barretti TaxID=519541 RepID=A0AA35TD79_GEOBA|nr:hypothetical protein GBAR_LOCUS25133 [Geodia barretti]
MAPRGGEILMLLLLVPAHCFAQEILHAPESTTVFLNQSAVFTCEARGGKTLWRINGTQRELLLPVLFDLVVSEITTPEGVLVTNLTIPARAQYNGTIVQCLSGVFGGPFVESDNATLAIQGPLSAVGDLKVDAKNGTSSTISWTAPFSLDVTGVDPDIWYSVLIYNVTDEKNLTAILCTDCINITETHYTFTPDYLSPCHVYIFSVIPLNGAGQGESSPNITDETKFPEVEVEALNDSHCEVAFSHEQVHTVSVYNDTVEFDANNGTNGTVFILPADGEYSATIEDPTACGKEKINKFTTYDVQEPHAESTDGRKIVVNGVLIGNSRAKGCFVVIQCNFSTQITFIALKRNGENRRLSGAISTPTSNYTVYMHDLEKDGLPNVHPANLVPFSVDITRGDEKHQAPNDENLKNASISLLGSSLEITCTPDEQSASCILVYRAYGKYMLNCEETFPVVINLDPDMNYTFALFRRINNNTDERPFLNMFFEGKEDPSQQHPLSAGIKDGGERAKTTPSILAVILGVLVALCCFILQFGCTAPLMGRMDEDGCSKKGSKYAMVETSLPVVRPSIPHAIQSRTRRLTSALVMSADYHMIVT